MKYVSLAFVFAMVFSGCDNHHKNEHHHGPNCSHGHASSHEKKDHHHHKHEHGEKCAHEHEVKEVKECHTPSGGHKRVTIKEATQKVMGLKTVKPQKRRICASMELQGRFELEPTARQVFAAPVAGRIELFVKPLANVKKGDILFTISSPNLVARAREIDILEKRLSVYTEMKTRNAALENELSLKRAEREALISGAEEKGGIVTVRSDKDGVVEALMAKTGDWLEIGSVALEMVNMKALRFKALVEPSEANRLIGVTDANVDSLTGELRLGVPGENALVPVYVVFKENINSVAGMRAVASVVTNEEEDEKLAIPSKCIVRSGIEPIIFVQDNHDKESFIALPVTPGKSSGTWTAIEENLGCDVNVVSDGAYELKLAIPGEEKKKSGHFHADGVFHEGEH